MKFREREHDNHIRYQVFSGPMKNPQVPVIQKKSKPGLRLWTRLGTHFLVIRS